MNTRPPLLASTLTLMLTLAASASSQPTPDASFEEFRAFERALLAAPPVAPAVLASEVGVFRVDAFEVELPDGRALPLFVQAPPDYDPERRAPLLLAMHGGPTGDADSSVRGAIQMLRVWRAAAAEAGYIVASPAMTHVVVRGPRTAERLPYEILRPDQIDAILRVLSDRYAIDPNRIVSTGISLGSNFSIAFAASRPGRLSAIVPVSTEGESREALLRNLMHVPAFVLEGSLDPNIRSIQGPRALARILEAFGYDFVYEELDGRGHEGFQEYYPGVLEWLSERPRTAYPLEVLRVPHDGIMPLARRAHWIESDTRAGIVRGRVVDRNRIDLEARFARAVRVHVHDRLVDLDEPIRIWVNGELAHEGAVVRSISFAREFVEATSDPGRVYAGSVLVSVPETAPSVARGHALSRALDPSTAPGTLSFWESYAIRSLEDRLPPLGARGVAVTHGSHERTALRVEQIEDDSFFSRAGVRADDTILAIDDEPFFTRDTVNTARAWLARELDHLPREVTITIERDGKKQTLLAELSLLPF